jgi:hypothetical protein
MKTLGTFSVFMLIMILGLRLEIDWLMILAAIGMVACFVFIVFRERVRHEEGDFHDTNFDSDWH